MLLFSFKRRLEIMADIQNQIKKALTLPLIFPPIGLLALDTYNDTSGTINEKIAGVEKSASSDMKLNSCVLKIDKILTSVESPSQSVIDFQLDTGQEMAKKGIKWTRQKKANTLCSPTLLLPKFDGDGSSEEVTVEEPDAPNQSSKYLPFTHCKLVLGLWEEGENTKPKNPKQVWSYRQKEGEFVCYDWITPNEKEELKKQLPGIKRTERGEQTSGETFVQSELEKNVENILKCDSKTSQIKQKINCRFPTRITHRSRLTLRNSPEEVKRTKNKPMGTYIGVTPAVEELPNQDISLVGKKTSIKTKATNLGESGSGSKIPPVGLIYRCPYCSQTFIEAGSLIDHLPLHSESGPKANQEEPNESKIQQEFDTNPPTLKKRNPRKVPRTSVKGLASPNGKNPAEDEPFKCKHCDHFFRTFRSLRVHERCRHKGLVLKGPTMHKCSFCNYSCNSLIIVKNHMKLHTEEGRPYKCLRCSCSFKLYRYLRAHVSRFHKQIETKWGNSSHHFKNDREKLRAKKSRPSTFGKSKRILKRPNNQVKVVDGRRAKISNVQNQVSNEILQPNFCTLKLTRCDNLLEQYGLLGKGSRSDSIKDRACMIKVKADDNQKRNLKWTTVKKSIHPKKPSAVLSNFEILEEFGGVKKWKCKTCEKIVSSSRTAYRHWNLHLGIRQKSSYCQTTFSKNDNFNHRVKKEHSNYISLDEKRIRPSPKPSAPPASLKRKLSKANTLGKRSTKCSYCQMEFKKSNVLMRHVMVTHLGMMRRKCCHCEKHFRNAYDLRMHLKIHSKAEIPKNKWDE